MAMRLPTRRRRIPDAVSAAFRRAKMSRVPTVTAVTSWSIASGYFFAAS
ncbi:hypothetical protein BH09MYX1_BH09MYX1_64040 [soil metagenome]